MFEAYDSVHPRGRRPVFIRNCAEARILIGPRKKRTAVAQLTLHGAGAVSGHLVWMDMHSRGHTTTFASEQFESVKDRGKEFQRGFVAGVQEANSSSAAVGILAICDLMASKYGPDGSVPGLWKAD